MLQKAGITSYRNKCEFCKADVLGQIIFLQGIIANPARGSGPTFWASFTTKRLNELGPHLQRFRMCLLELDFRISHIPGKEMHTAYVLSHKPPLREVEKNGATSLNEAVWEYELLMVKLLPASSDMPAWMITEIRKIQLHVESLRIVPQAGQACHQKCRDMLRSQVNFPW